MYSPIHKDLEVKHFVSIPERAEIQGVRSPRTRRGRSFPALQLAVVGTLLVLGGRVGACPPQAAQQRDGPGPVALAPALAPVDTAIFAPSPTPADVAHYATPGLCWAAAVYTSVVQRRTDAAQSVLDTIRQTAPTRDTLPAAAVAVAQACLRHFTVAGTPVPQLVDLFTAALQAGEDSLARAVVGRQLALAATPAARRAVQLDAIQAYLAAEPARVAAAESVVAQVDAAGAPATRLAAHERLLAFARSTYDTTRMRQEAERIIAAGQAGPFAAIQYHYEPLINAYDALMAIAFVAHPDSMPALAARAQHDLQRFPPGKDFPDSVVQATLAYMTDYKTMSVQQLLAQLTPMPPEEQSAVNTVPAPLQATYWYPRPAHWPPGDGPLSLVVYANHGTCVGPFHVGENYGDCGAAVRGISGNETSRQVKFVDIVARLAARFSQRGLSITVVAETWPGASLGLLPDATTANAEAIRWYYQDYLKLPVTVAVVVDTVQPLRAPDGRVFPCDASPLLQVHVCGNRTPNTSRYANYNDPAVLLDRAGHLLYAGVFTPAVGFWETLVETRLAAGGASPPAPVAARGRP
jgi:hypothetical protein